MVGWIYLISSSNLPFLFNWVIWQACIDWKKFNKYCTDLINEIIKGGPLHYELLQYNNVFVLHSTIISLFIFLAQLKDLIKHKKQ
jgi:hypothetical protein